MAEPPRTYAQTPQAPLRAAMTAPSSLVATLAGAGAGALLTGTLVGAVLIGLLGFAVAAAVNLRLRGRTSQRAVTYPRTLRQPWRYHARQAVEAEQRFSQAVATAGPGPLGERLARIDTRMADGARQAVEVARRGDELERALYKLESAVANERRIAELEQDGVTGEEASLIASLRGQVETFRRLEGTVTDTKRRLEVLNAQLDESVARALELGVHADDPTALEPQLGGLGAEVDRVVTDLEALRRGLDELRRGGL